MSGTATPPKPKARCVALELQEGLLKQSPSDIAVKSALGAMYHNLGNHMVGLKRYPEAVAAFERAIDGQRQAVAQAPDILQYRLFLNKHYYGYARALRASGRVDEALQVTLQRRDLWPDNPDELFSVASELALAASERAVKSNTGATAADYADRALESLKQAVAAGWKPKADSDWTKSFAAIRNRPDFPALTF